MSPTQTEIIFDRAVLRLVNVLIESDVRSWPEVSGPVDDVLAALEARQIEQESEIVDLLAAN